MQDKEQDNLDNDFENHTSDLHDQKNHLRKIQAYVIFAVGGLLLVLILVYFLKSFLSSNTTTEEVQKEDNKDLAQSVKTKEFIPPPPQKTFDELIAQESPKPTQDLILEPKPPKPRIVKGAGVTVVASSNNDGFGKMAQETGKNLEKNLTQCLSLDKMVLYKTLIIYKVVVEILLERSSLPQSLKLANLIKIYYCLKELT